MAMGYDSYNNPFGSLGGMSQDEYMRQRMCAMMNQKESECARVEAKPVPKPQQDPLFNHDLLLLETA